MKHSHAEVLLEQILHEVKATNEGVAAIWQMVARKPDREEFDDLKADVKTIKAAVADVSDDLAALRQQTGSARPGQGVRSRWWARKA